MPGIRPKETVTKLLDFSNGFAEHRSQKEWLISKIGKAPAAPAGLPSNAELLDMLEKKKPLTLEQRRTLFSIPEFAKLVADIQKKEKTGPLNEWEGKLLRIVPEMNPVTAYQKNRDLPGTKLLPNSHFQNKFGTDVIVLSQERLKTLAPSEVVVSVDGDVSTAGSLGANDFLLTYEGLSRWGLPKKLATDKSLEALRANAQGKEAVRRSLLSDPAKLDLAVAGMIYGKPIPPHLVEPLKTFLQLQDIRWSPELEAHRSSILSKIDKKQMLTDQEAQAISKISPDLLGSVMNAMPGIRPKETATKLLDFSNGFAEHRSQKEWLISKIGKAPAAPAGLPSNAELLDMLEKKKPLTLEQRRTLFAIPEFAKLVADIQKKEKTRPLEEWEKKLLRIAPDEKPVTAYQKNRDLPGTKLLPDSHSQNKFGTDVIVLSQERLRTLAPSEVVVSVDGDVSTAGSLGENDMILTYEGLSRWGLPKKAPKKTKPKKTLLASFEALQGEAGTKVVKMSAPYDSTSIEILLLPVRVLKKLAPGTLVYNPRGDAFPVETLKFGKSKANDLLNLGLPKLKTQQELSADEAQLRYIDEQVNSFNKDSADQQAIMRIVGLLHHKNAILLDHAFQLVFASKGTRETEALAQQKIGEGLKKIFELQKRYMELRQAPAPAPTPAPVPTLKEREVSQKIFSADPANRQEVIRLMGTARQNPAAFEAAMEKAGFVIIDPLPGSKRQEWYNPFTGSNITLPLGPFTLSGQEKAELDRPLQGLGHFEHSSLKPTPEQQIRHLVDNIGNAGWFNTSYLEDLGFVRTPGRIGVVIWTNPKTNARIEYPSPQAGARVPDPSSTDASELEAALRGKENFTHSAAAASHQRAVEERISRLVKYIGTAGWFNAKDIEELGFVRAPEKVGVNRWINPQNGSTLEYPEPFAGEKVPEPSSTDAADLEAALRGKGNFVHSAASFYHKRETESKIASLMKNMDNANWFNSQDLRALGFMRAQGREGVTVWANLKTGSTIEAPAAQHGASVPTPTATDRIQFEQALRGKGNFTHSAVPKQ